MDGGHCVIYSESNYRSTYPSIYLSACLCVFQRTISFNYIVAVHISHYLVLIECLSFERNSKLLHRLKSISKCLNVYAYRWMLHVMSVGRKTSANVTE